jgi:hypothetical protein
MKKAASKENRSGNTTILTRKPPGKGGTGFCLDPVLAYETVGNLSQPGSRAGRIKDLPKSIVVAPSGFKHSPLQALKPEPNKINSP